METIGLTFGDMANLLTSSCEAALKALEPSLELSIKKRIENGCSEDEAQFRSGITAEISSASTAILTVIEANNNSILANLTKAGIFRH